MKKKIKHNNSVSYETELKALNEDLEKILSSIEELELNKLNLTDKEEKIKINSTLSSLRFERDKIKNSIITREREIKKAEKQQEKEKEKAEKEQEKEKEKAEKEQEKEREKAEKQQEKEKEKAEKQQEKEKEKAEKQQKQKQKAQEQADQQKEFENNYKKISNEISSFQLEILKLKPIYFNIFYSIPEQRQEFVYQNVEIQAKISILEKDIQAVKEKDLFLLNGSMKSREKREKQYQELFNQLDILRFELNFLSFLVNKEIKIYKLSFDKKEVFVYTKNNYISSNLYISNLYMSLELEFYETFNISFIPKFDLYKFLVNYNYLMDLQDTNYLPLICNPIFIEDGKKYLNVFIAGKYEEEIKLLEDQTQVKPKIEEVIKKYKFPYIEDLIRHLVGDKTIYLKYIYELLTNEKYKQYKTKSEIQKIIINLNLNQCLDTEKTIIEHCKKLLEEEKPNIEEYTKYYLYFLKWLGFIFQNPIIKLPCGIGFKSVQGVGKDFFTSNILTNIFGNQNINNIGQTSLESSFNGWLINKRFIICNELKFRNRESNIYETIKRLMADQNVTITEKNKTERNIKNYAHFLFFSNEENPFRVEKSDRRITIYEQTRQLPTIISNSLSPNNKYSSETLHKELKQFTLLLNNIPVDYLEVKTPIETEIKTQIQEYHKTDVEIFFDAFNEFENMEDMINYYIKYSHIVNIPYNTFSNYLEHELYSKDKKIPNSILYNLFICVMTEQGIKSIRSSRSLFKEISKYIQFRPLETQERYNNKVESMRDLKLFPYHKEQTKQEDQPTKQEKVEEFTYG
jgi:hypothetical protein